MDLFNHRSILPLFKQQQPKPSSSRHFLSFSTFLDKRHIYCASIISVAESADGNNSFDSTHENALPFSDAYDFILVSSLYFNTTWYVTHTLRAFLIGTISLELLNEIWALTLFRNVRYNLIGEGWPSFPSLPRNIFIIQTDKIQYLFLHFVIVFIDTNPFMLAFVVGSIFGSLFVSSLTRSKACNEIWKFCCASGKFKGNDGGSRKWVTFKSSLHIPLFSRSIVSPEF